MLCPNCGNETPDNFEFCANCGAKLIKEIEQPQESKNGLKFIRCRNCGKEMLESFEFCASCGAKLKTNEQTKYKTVNYNVDSLSTMLTGSTTRCSALCPPMARMTFSLTRTLVR